MADNKNLEEGGKSLTSEELLDKLRRALQKDGDFPTSAKIVNELRMLTSDPKTTANQITEVILREPSLGTRVLALVNSSFYRRAKPIMTVSQAVIQIGMKPLAELCANLVLLQKFVPAAREGGHFANCLRKAVVTSLLASSIGERSRSSTDSKNNESGFLAGSFAELGTLLLAYYFPPIYANAVKRAESKKLDLGKAIHEITGLTTFQLSKEVVQALGLPNFYIDVLNSAESPAVLPKQAEKLLSREEQEVLRMSRSVHAAQSISSTLTQGKDKQDLDQVINRLRESASLDIEQFNSVIASLPSLFKEHCSSIEVNLPSLPAYVESYSLDQAAAPQEQQAEDQSDTDEFSQFVEEIRQIVDSREPTASVITTVMETLAFQMHFDRVILMLSGPGKKKLMGRMMLGKADNFDPTKLLRPVEEADEFAPDARAFKEGRPVFAGDPIIEDGWPIVAMPIGFGSRAVGIIYADRINQDDVELTSREQAAIGVLAELLDRSISMQSR